MIGLEFCQDAGTGQKVVYQGVDGNHAGANLMPEMQALRGRQQDARQRHGQDLVRDAIDLSDRSNQSFSQFGEPVGAGCVIGSLESPVDPAHQVGIGDVADEQEKRLGHLVEPTVAQLVGGQGTCVDVIRLCTGPTDLVVSAAVEMPVAFELGASGTSGNLGVDIGPSGPPVPFHVVGGDLVRDALVAQSRNQPIKQRRGVVAPDGRRNAFGPQVGADVVD